VNAAEIRSSFLQYFAGKGHTILPSSPLVPADDPTLLFTNAGMVQFKRVFLGQTEIGTERAVTSQKCVRAGGKHNDLEEVGKTARHHTFFEMLGNFSFGDYFKRDAIHYAWEFLTDELGLDPNRIFVTIHHTDNEAGQLWQGVAGVPAERIYSLGDKDNFWQMADTGPCGPCSELHYDMRPEAEWGVVLPTEEFEERGEAGEFLEIWNLVFMQYDRDAEGTLNPLPAPSIDTGAGLERLAACLQGADSNYHTDVFSPLLAAVARVVGRPYRSDTDEGVSYRVLADHARAVAFLLADGVFPSNEGRGYVLRRILRRAVRHAWLLGRRDPTLVDVVAAVIEHMGEAYPELSEGADHLLRTTRAEEDRFLATIEAGLARFDQLAPLDSGGDHVIDGDEAFKLYDTFGFPLDLTELMAEERGYSVDTDRFQAALEAQRQRSRDDRAASNIGVDPEDLLDGWSEQPSGGHEQTFTGYTDLLVETEIISTRSSGDSLAIQLAANPFYAEGGGQISDGGSLQGEGWSARVDDVVKVNGRVALVLSVDGEPPEEGARCTAQVDADARRRTQRNHTATHLLHAALRATLGEHVVQRGSLVEPGRLRFDFAHTSPMTAEEKAKVQRIVNEGVWVDHPVITATMAHAEAIAKGAMALFGEKYGDVVRVVEIPGVSTELCGGTHVSHTGDIGLFKLVSESGVSSGVRRIEAVTGSGAFDFFLEREERLEEVAAVLGAKPEHAVARVQQLLDEVRELEKLLDDLRSDGGAGEATILEAEVDLDGTVAVVKAIRLKVRDADDARTWGDAFLGRIGSGVAAVAAEFPGGKHTLFTFVTDDLIREGIRADRLVRELARFVDGKGGGRPHMAQAGVGDPSRIDEALKAVEATVRELAESSA
jgi:alanyl-tRNA synthetase